MPNYTGTEAGEALVGTAEADLVEGLGGADSLDGAGGADVMKGGAGDDIYYVDDAGDQAIEIAGEGNDEVRSTVGFVLGDFVERLTLIGAAAVDGTGNGLNNLITGNDAANQFYDGGGSDTFVGGGGDDIFHVRADVVEMDGGYAFGGVDQVVELAGGGNDTIETNAGGNLPAGVENMILIGTLNLTAFGNALDNVITGNAGRNFIRAGDGNDYIDGGDGADNMDGGKGNDTYVVDDPQDNLFEAPDGGVDTVRSSISHALGFSFENLVLTGGDAIDGTGNSRDNTITGNGVANRLFGDGGNDTVDGGAGADDIDGSFGNDVLRGGDGNDVLRGGPNDDTSFGGDGDDTFYNDDFGTDSAIGGAGNDGFYFGSRLDAADIVDGGAGIDTLVIRGLTPPDFRFGVANLVGIEVLLVASGANTTFPSSTAGTYSYDLITRDENVAAGMLLTVIAGPPGAGIPGLQAGEALAFDGSAENDGAFRIFAGLGADNLIGGAGNDGFFFADGALTATDRIVGGGGTDSVALRGHYDGAGRLVLGDATISGVEVLALLSAHEAPYGGGVSAEGFGYDIVLANANVGAGRSLDIVGSPLGADERLLFDGSAELDGNLRIFGGAADDVLRGGAQADTLFGGLGRDQMNGGAGGDLYAYRSTAESRSGSSDSLIFGAGDRIDLSFIDADPASSGNQAFSFIGSAAFSGTAGELRVEGNGTAWHVGADQDGDGIADLVIDVTSAQPLVAGDFVL
jgi:Ca2+-binding RTX toxin-like protein